MPDSADRYDVWEALSDLWLDTELQDWQLDGVAGEWAGFSRDWLMTECRRRADRNGRWSARLLTAFLRWNGNPAYDAVRARLVRATEDAAE